MAENSKFFFGKVEEGILLPAANYRSEKGMEALRKKLRAAGVVDPGNVLELFGAFVFFRKGKDGKLTDEPISFQYGMTADSFRWSHVRDFRKKVVELASANSEDSFQLAADWALAHPAKYQIFQEKMEGRFGKVADGERWFVTLNDPVPKEPASDGKAKVFRLPMKNVAQKDVPIQEAMFGKPTIPVSLQLASPEEVVAAHKSNDDFQMEAEPIERVSASA